MLYLLLASLSEHKPGQAIVFANQFDPGSSFNKLDNSEALPPIDEIEVFMMLKDSTSGKYAAIGIPTQSPVAYVAANALLSAQPLLWNEKKLGSLLAEIFLYGDINTEVRGDSSGLAYSLHLLEELAVYDTDGSQRFIDTNQALRKQVIGATGVIDQVGQVSRVEDVADKLEAFVIKLQNDWPEIQETTGEAHPRIVFLLPKENLAELDPQVLKQAKESLDALSPNVDIVGIERLSTAIQTLVGDRFPVVGLQQSPYKGLNSFDPEDRLLFFGREEEVRVTLKKMEEYRTKEIAHRHCIIFGDSGAGKSSFVKAGMLPILSPQTHSELQNWVILKPGDGQGQLLDHFIDSLRPTINPNDQKNLLNLPWRMNPVQAIRDFADLYISARADLKAPASLVLVIDQAEELLIMPEAGNEINQFKLILQAFSSYHHSKLNTRPLEFKFWLITTIRKADFKNYLSLLACKNEKAQFYPYYLEGLNPSKDFLSFQAIIENPARMLGIRVDPKLTQHLLSVIIELQNPLPSLEYTLDELYQHAVKTRTLNQGLTLKAFNSIIGSMSDLITRHAQALLDELKQDSGIRNQIPVFFSLLMGVDKTHGLAYSNPTKIKVFKKSADLHQLYRAFVDHRFLHEDHKNVRFSHEVLIREWNEVKQWEKATVQKQQKQKIRNLLISLVFSIGLIFIASYAAYYANQQSDIAIKERDIAKENKELANQQTDIAKAQRDKALITESRFLADLSLKSTESGNARLGALLALEALPDYSESEGERRPYIPEAQRSLYATLNRYMDRFWFLHSSAVNNVAFSPNGRKIVTTSGDDGVRLWNADTGQVEELALGHTDSVFHAAFSPNGNLIVTASGDKTARLWDVDKRKVVSILKGHTGSIFYAVFSPDGHKIITTSGDKTARLWDADTGQVIAVLKGHTGAVILAVFSPDGTKFVTSAGIYDTHPLLWDTYSREVLAVLKGHTGTVDNIVFSQNGRKIVTASSYIKDSTARIWDADMGKVLFELKGDAGTIDLAVLSPNGRKIVTASKYMEDGTLQLWDANTGQTLAELKGHKNSIFHVSFSADGHKIITASKDNTARLWDVDKEKTLAVLRGHAVPVGHAVFSPKGNKIVTTSWDDTVRLWNAEIEQTVTILKGHTNSVTFAAFSPNGNKIVTTSKDSTARIWDVDTGQTVVELKGHMGSINFAAFSPNGNKIVTTSKKSTARIWDVDTGQTVTELKGHIGSVDFAAFSPDGNMIVTTGMSSLSNDNIARVWNVNTGKVVAMLEGHKLEISHAAFSPDGNKIVTSSLDNTARIWNVTTGNVVAVLQGHKSFVDSVAYSPDGRMIVTASNDKTARIWDAVTGQSIVVLNGPVRDASIFFPNGYGHAAFSPDGRRIVTASLDKTTRVWDVATGQEVSALKEYTGTVNTAFFSPDGRQIITSSDDKTARVWDAYTGEIIAELKGHTDDVNIASFSPNGSIVLTASNDGTARLWKNYSTEELVSIVKKINLPPLTPEERRKNYLD